MAKARSLNKVQLIGNLTRDPIIKETANNVTVATFGVATNSIWKDSDGNTQERAEFHNIVAFNKLAEICAQVLSVGMLVYIEGELRTRVKEEDGKKLYRTEIKLNDMLLLDSKDKKGVGIEEAKVDTDDEDYDDESGEEDSKEEKEEKKEKEESDDEFSGDELF
jgi:single-strand DNA-binding protein